MMGPWPPPLPKRKRLTKKDQTIERIARATYELGYHLNTWERATEFPKEEYRRAVRRAMDGQPEPEKPPSPTDVLGILAWTDSM